MFSERWMISKAFLATSMNWRPGQKMVAHGIPIRARMNISRSFEPQYSWLTKLLKLGVAKITNCSGCTHGLHALEFQPRLDGKPRAGPCMRLGVMLVTSGHG